jgi:hypothetical protein
MPYIFAFGRPSIILAMKAISLAALIPLLASCASSGLYYMSDEWCAAHLGASAARCPEKKDAQRRVADNDRPRIAAIRASGSE